MEGASGREAYEEAWRQIEPPSDILSRRYYPAAVAINNTEIAILAGYDTSCLIDVVLFNTVDESLKKVAEDADGGYYPNTNQAALIAHEEIVVLTGRDGNKKPSLITWKKGKKRIEQIQDLETEGFSREPVQAPPQVPIRSLARAAPAKLAMKAPEVAMQAPARAKAATPPRSAAASDAAASDAAASEARATPP